jgi:hypothetical protein
MKRFLLLSVMVMTMAVTSRAQLDSTLLRRIPKDTIRQTMNMDAIYNRPFLGIGKLPVSVGGYVEANWQHLGTDGVSEGHQFQFRRMTLFFASTLSRHIKFLSELEFEDGTKEISIEFAALDFEFHPLLNLRGGMILNPIGAFNQNHDGPKWEFTDRPIAMTQMLPATWSNVGFGLFGKQYNKNWMFGYEIYLTGGFDNSIIDNPQNKTYLPAAKMNPNRFEESVTGEPLLSGKVGLRNNKIGELGLSYMGGIYNQWQKDGHTLDQKRGCHVLDIDFNTRLPHIKTYITAEWAWVFVNVPETYSQQYGTKQQGEFIDIVQPVLQRPMFGWSKAVVNLSCRLEYVDWNIGKFNETGGKIGDDLWSLMPGLSLRPTSQTVLRLNYRYLMQHDILGNLPATTAGFIFGISSYF